MKEPSRLEDSDVNSALDGVITILGRNGASDGVDVLYSQRGEYCGFSCTVTTVGSAGAASRAYRNTNGLEELRSPAVCNCEKAVRRIDRQHAVLAVTF